MPRTLRVLFHMNGGFVRRQATEEETEQARQSVYGGILEKWQKDPGIRFISYFNRPGVGHYTLFEVDDIGKVGEMDQDVYSTKGTYLEKYGLEIVAGITEADAFWTSWRGIPTLRTGSSSQTIAPSLLVWICQVL